MLGRPEGWGRGGGGPGQLPGVQRAGRAGGAKRRSETQLQSMVELALQRGQTDRRMRTGWSRRERQTGVMGAGTAPPPRSQPAWCPRPLPPTSRPACLLQRAPLCLLVPRAPGPSPGPVPCPSLPASPPGSLPFLCTPSRTRGSQPPSSLLTHSLTHPRWLPPPAHPAPSLLRSLHPSPLARPLRVRLCVSGSPSVSLCGCPKSLPLPTSWPHPAPPG